MVTDGFLFPHELASLFELLKLLAPTTEKELVTKLSKA